MVYIRICAAPVTPLEQAGSSTQQMSRVFSSTCDDPPSPKASLSSLTCFLLAVSS